MAEDTRVIPYDPVTQEGRLIGALLRVPFHAVVRTITAGLHAQGHTELTPAHMVVFQQIDEIEGTRLTELADRAQITKQSMSYLVEYLERLGYVERLPDPIDGRARRIRLTERGMEVMRIARDVVLQLEADWAQRLGVQELHQLRTLLKKLVISLQSP